MPKSLPTLATFAANFRALCSRASLSQAQVAEIAGASQSTIGAWQRGESSPGVVELARLCQHFGVAADYMIGICEFPSGLAPDSWVVDLAAVENPKAREKWAFKVPRRARIVDFEELERMKEEADHRSRKRSS